MARPTIEAFLPPLSFRDAVSSRRQPPQPSFFSATFIALRASGASAACWERIRWPLRAAASSRAAPHERRYCARAGRPAAGAARLAHASRAARRPRGAARGAIGARLGVLAAALLLALSTPLVSGLLLVSLDSPARPMGASPPAAILVLGAETRTGPDGADVGPLTLEEAAPRGRSAARDRPAAAGHRRCDHPPDARRWRN